MIIEISKTKKMFKKNPLFLLMSLTLIFQQCQKKESPTENKEEISVAQASTKPDGLQFAEVFCYICHSPSASESERTAPPMIAIKAHYLQQEGMSRDEFIDAIVSYVQNPTEEKAKLPGAVNRFGLMPMQQVPTEELRQIAAYIYDYQIEEPAWFQEHYEQRFGKPYLQNGQEKVDAKPTTPKEIALSYALETKQLLGKNLQQKLKQEGPEKALEFCNLEAMPLTKSVADKYNLSIKRVSDKPRNPENTANEAERKYIEMYKTQLLEHASTKPTEHDGYLYLPIVTNSMCLQCHGEKGKDIKPEVVNKISELYPKDQATGYQENQIRGLFVVEIPK